MEEDLDTITKHVAKAYSKGHVIEQTNLRVSVKVEEQDIEGAFTTTHEYTRKITVPTDMRDSFVERMEAYLTTNE